MPFENTPLPYAFDALEPYIDARTMEIHHDRHLQAYIDGLNRAIAPFPALQNCTAARLAVLNAPALRCIRPRSAAMRAACSTTASILRA